MKKFTDKQIDIFIKMLEDGILENFTESGIIDIINTIIEAQGISILSKCNIETNDFVEIAEDRCELMYLDDCVYNAINKSHKKIKEVPPKNKFIEMLGLLPWADKNDIINELNLVL